MSNECTQIEQDTQNNKDTSRMVSGRQTGKDRKSNAPPKCIGKKGTKGSSQCQRHIPQKWSGGKVGSGTYFGHVKLDDFKSKSPEEMAWIKALRDSTKQQYNKKQRISSCQW